MLALEVLAVSHPCIDVSSHTHGRMPVQFNLFSGEEMVNLLQGKIACLRVEEVDQRKEAEIENCQTKLE